MRKIVINVGANQGNAFNQFIDDNTIIYAFEPTHELLSRYLYPKSENNSNIIIIPFAVDVENTFKIFNIAGQSDWGCSSLYEFSDDIEDKWNGRTDFKKTHSYIVPTITLYDFCEIYKIDKIDYLFIDAQGSDFNVLKSLKDKINIVEEGVIEASNNVDLYKNVNNRIEDIRDYLISNGFIITDEIPNDTIDAEINLFFKRI